jgi:hypothetical protein
MEIALLQIALPKWECTDRNFFFNFLPVVIYLAW